MEQTDKARDNLSPYQLAAGLALQQDPGRLRGLALVYPALGGDPHGGSYTQMAEAPGLSTQDVLYYRDILQAPPEDPVAHPLRAKDLSGLPPTFVSAARFDPLRDDAAAFAPSSTQPRQAAYRSRLSDQVPTRWPLSSVL